MQLAIYKRSGEVELGATENNISYRSTGFVLATTDFKPGALSTRPRCLSVSRYTYLDKTVSLLSDELLQAMEYRVWWVTDL